MHYQTEPLAMWFDRRLVMRKSAIQCIGTFATHAIAPGEVLMMVTGVLSSPQRIGNRGSCTLKALCITKQQ
jgi:hypothetical protein